MEEPTGTTPTAFGNDDEEVPILTLIDPNYLLLWMTTVTVTGMIRSLSKSAVNIIFETSPTEAFHSLSKISFFVVVVVVAGFQQDALRPMESRLTKYL